MTKWRMKQRTLARRAERDRKWVFKGVRRG